MVAIRSSLMKYILQYSNQASEMGNKFAMQRLRILNEVEQVFWEARSKSMRVYVCQRLSIPNWQYFHEESLLNLKNSTIGRSANTSINYSQTTTKLKSNPQLSNREYEKYDLYQVLLSVNTEFELALHFNNDVEHEVLKGQLNT
jgi:hypothetical protein